MKQQVMYLVVVCRGECEDYTESHIFVTLDKQKAETWRDKYNRIIKDNKERIDKYYNDHRYDKPKLFWQYDIEYENPIAKIYEVKVR